LRGRKFTVSFEGWKEENLPFVVREETIEKKDEFYTYVLIRVLYVISFPVVEYTYFP